MKIVNDYKCFLNVLDDNPKCVYVTEEFYCWLIDNTDCRTLNVLDNKNRPKINYCGKDIIVVDDEMS